MSIESIFWECKTSLSHCLSTIISGQVFVDAIRLAVEVSESKVLNTHKMLCVFCIEVARVATNQVWCFGWIGHMLMSALTTGALWQCCGASVWAGTILSVPYPIQNFWWGKEWIHFQDRWCRFGLLLQWQPWDFEACETVSRLYCNKPSTKRGQKPSFCCISS